MSGFYDKTAGVGAGMLENIDFSKTEFSGKVWAKDFAPRGEALNNASIGANATEHMQTILSRCEAVGQAKDFNPASNPAAASPQPARVRGGRE